MGGLLHSFDMKLQEKRLKFWIKDFLHKRLKKFWYINTLNVTIEKTIVLRVTKTQNTMLFDLLSVFPTNFSLYDVNAEFVNSIFLIISALS